MAQPMNWQAYGQAAPGAFPVNPGFPNVFPGVPQAQQFPTVPPMAQAQVIPQAQVLQAQAAQPILDDLDLSNLTTAEIKRLSSYGGVLNFLTSDQIDELLKDTKVIINENERRPPLPPRRRYFEMPNGSKAYY